MSSQKPKHWLMKTEPSVFSFDQLCKAPKKTASWEGVRNYQARNFMRDEFELGDEVFIYHSGEEVPSIVGTAEVVRKAYPDPTALDPKSAYYDEKSDKDGHSRWVMVDVKAKSRFTSPVSIGDVRKTKGLEGMLLIKKGQRLSIQPVEKKHWDIIIKLGKPKAV